MKLAHIADKVAADVYRRPISNVISQREIVRYACDLATDQELSVSMLDRLCDMVQRRLRNMPVSEIAA
jgi:hypothetical protein